METTHEPFDQPVLEADKVGLGDFSQSFTDDGWDKLYGTITIEDEFDKRPTSPVNFSSGREDVMSSNFNYVAEPPREVEQRLHSPYQNNFLANHQQSFTQVSRQALDGPSFSQSLVSRPRSTTDMHHPQTFPKIQHSNILKNNNHYGINASQKNGGFSDFKTDNGQRQMQMRQGIQMEGLANHNNYVNLKVLQNKSELYKGNGLSKQAHSNLPNHLEMNAQSVSNSRSIPNMMSYKQGQAYHGGGITSASNSEIQKNIGPSDYRSTINGINVNHLNLQNIQNPNLNSINTPVNTNPQQFLSTGNSQRLAIHSIGNEKSSSANNIHPRAPSNLQQPLNQAHLHQLQINHQRRIQNRTPSVFPVNPPQGQNPFLSYCYLVNVSFPAIGMHISPDRVAMLLKRTHDVFAKTSFVWARLQQPKRKFFLIH